MSSAAAAPPRSMEGTLTIVAPELGKIGNPPLALVGRGRVNTYSWDAPPHGKLHGRGLKLACGPASNAATFILEIDSMAIRFKDKDPDLQLMMMDAQGGQQKSAEGQNVNLHATLERPEWKQPWILALDGTIGPGNTSNPKCKDLCLGIDPDGDGQIIMVPRNDEARCLIFGGTLMEKVANRSTKIAAAFPPKLPNSDSTILLIKSPPMPWLGRGQKAIVKSGDLVSYEMKGKHKGLHGVFGKLVLGKATDAAEWFVEGPPENMIFRLQEDRRVVLDYAYGTHTSSVGQAVNTHGTLERKEWAAKSIFSPDGTIGPQNHLNKEASSLCLGYHREKDGSTVIKLIKRTDVKHRLVFGSKIDVEEYVNVAMEERRLQEAAREKLRNDAAARCTPELKRRLMEDGFAKIEGGIPMSVVLEARKEINREIGLSSTTTDSFKAKTFASHPAITNLFKASMAPHIASLLMGGSPEFYRRQASGGQLALRFPGDMCDKDKAECSVSKFNGVRKGWHIDGCASDFIPGLTDHYGTIHNFSMLVGCLLSDVPASMSGELCCYPGSHTKLAEYMKAPGMLDKLKAEGHKALPTGEKTDELFDRPVFHGTGKAGTLFIANYMTAHFIAPNTAPDIRYAVYFRIKNPRFQAGKQSDGSRPEAMLEPWSDWEGLEMSQESPASETKQPEAPALHSLSHEELLGNHAMDRHLLSADYSYTQALKRDE